MSKCVFGVPEVSFGHIISAEGIRTDPKKVEGITGMPVGKVCSQLG